MLWLALFDPVRPLFDPETRQSLHWFALRVSSSIVWHCGVPMQPTQPRVVGRPVPAPAPTAASLGEGDEDVGVALFAHPAASIPKRINTFHPTGFTGEP